MEKICDALNKRTQKSFHFDNDTLVSSRASLAVLYLHELFQVSVTIPIQSLTKEFSLKNGIELPFVCCCLLRVLY
jgi:hypothetical protein